MLKKILQKKKKIRPRNDMSKKLRERLSRKTSLKRINKKASPKEQAEKIEISIVNNFNLCEGRAQTWEDAEKLYCFIEKHRPNTNMLIVQDALNAINTLTKYKVDDKHLFEGPSCFNKEKKETVLMWLDGMGQMFFEYYWSLKEKGTQVWREPPDTCNQLVT